MSETSKKALLDTDFLFKTQLAQNRNREPLADLIMQFDGYDFFCHEKIISELQTHGFSPDPIPWIEEQVAKGRIQLFSDSRILDEIDELSSTFNDLFLRIKADFDRERQFSSDVSHELNTPLTVISGQTGLLLRWGKDNPEQHLF